MEHVLKDYLVFKFLEKHKGLQTARLPAFRMLADICLEPWNTSTNINFDFFRKTCSYVYHISKFRVSPKFIFEHGIRPRTSMLNFQKTKLIYSIHNVRGHVYRNMEHAREDYMYSHANPGETTTLWW